MLSVRNKTRLHVRSAKPYRFLNQEVPRVKETLPYVLVTIIIISPQEYKSYINRLLYHFTLFEQVLKV